MTPALTVAVCTRDRAPRLRELLAALGRCTRADPARFEVLVVDNGSGDDTRQAIADAEGPWPLRLVSEPRVGLARARNAALASFRGDWIAFTDDDAIVEQDWVSALLAAIDRQGAHQWLGGRSLARWCAPAPAWLRHADTPFVAGLSGHYDLGEADRPYADDDPPPFAVNMAFSRRAVEAVGGFRIDLGLGTGTRGEDTEYIARARAAGFAGRYLASALLHHPADPARLRLAALYRHGIVKGRTHARLGDLPAIPRGRAREALALLRAAAQALRGRGDNLRVGVVNAGMLRGLREG